MGEDDLGAGWDAAMAGARRNLVNSRIAELEAENDRLRLELNAILATVKMDKAAAKGKTDAS